MFGLAPSRQLPYQKDQPGPGHRCFHSNILTSFSMVCSQARMYQINYIDRQNNWDKKSWKWAVGNRHTPLRLQIYFYYCRKCWPALTACTGREGVCERVGSGVKWASGYNWYYVNQYARGLSSFIALLVFFVYTLKFLIHYFQNLSSFSAFLFTLRRPWKTGIFSVSPLACRRNAR